jgi:hypothetical protein
MGLVDEDEIRTELAAIRAKQRELGERVGALTRLLSYPHVVPVLVYDRYGSRYEEDALVVGYDAETADRPLLEQAYRELEAMADYGECAPVGVSVGGDLMEHGDLRDRFGDAS